MLEVAEALNLVLDRARPLAPIATDLSPAALGHVLAEPVLSDINSPPFTKSLMDGYAVRSADCASPGATLQVIEEVAAGKIPTLTVGRGQATRVMTGAPIPEGADAIVMHERTELTADRVTIRQSVTVGAYVLPRGREMNAGDVVLAAGAVLGPQEFGLLAAVGRTKVSAYPCPRLALISTGDELVEACTYPAAGQIRNSNGPMLLAQAARAGALPHYAGLARDDRSVLLDLARRAFDSADIVVLSGGVSAGKFDYVPGVLEELGVTPRFHKINLKPGRPLLFGTRGDTLVFGLPGNPVSSFVCFELFVRPAVRKLRGYADAAPAFVPVPLTSDFATTNDRPTYGPARLERSAEGLRVRPQGWFGSADLRGLAGADALVRVPAGASSYKAGEAIPTLFLNP